VVGNKLILLYNHKAIIDIELRSGAAPWQVTEFFEYTPQSRPTIVFTWLITDRFDVILEPEIYNVSARRKPSHDDRQRATKFL